MATQKHNGLPFLFSRHTCLRQIALGNCNYLLAALLK